MDVDQTRIMTAADRAESAIDRALHSLELIDGLYLGRRYLVARAGATLGRSAPADIVLAESEVSRAHCRITVEGDELVVTDLGSTNGTFVDGARVCAADHPAGGLGADGRTPVAAPPRR